MSNSTPRVGDTIHYQAFGTPGGEYQSVCRAAIVTEKMGEDGLLGVAVLNPTGMFFNRVEYDDSGKGGTWHYVCTDR